MADRSVMMGAFVVVALASVQLPWLQVAFAEGDPAPAAQAQRADDPSTDESSVGDCSDPATAPQPGPSSGTAPGNPGSTGWTGGTGGSFTGTTPQADADGATATGDVRQPETVTGLDLEGTPRRGC